MTTQRASQSRLHSFLWKKGLSKEGVHGCPDIRSEFSAGKEPLAYRVTIDVLSDDLQLVTSPKSLVFSSTDWNVPQLVRVVAIDDSTDEDSIEITIQHTVRSANPSYNSRAVQFSGLPAENASLNMLIDGPTDALTAEMWLRTSSVRESADRE